MSSPLPGLQHLTADQRQTEIRHIVAEIKAKADAENKDWGTAHGRAAMKDAD